MGNEIVVMDKQPRTGTLMLSEAFKNDHRSVVRLVHKNRESLEKISDLKSRKIQTKGRSGTEYFLTLGQFTFLVAQLRPSKETKEFVDQVVTKMENHAKALLTNKQIQASMLTYNDRALGKEARHDFTREVNKFVNYALDQGSTNAGRYYEVFTKLISKALFHYDGKTKSLRDRLSPSQLRRLSAVEDIMIDVLSRCMNEKMQYKDVYRSVRAAVQEFGSRYGKTYVATPETRQLSMF